MQALQIHLTALIRFANCGPIREAPCNSLEHNWVSHEELEIFVTNTLFSRRKANWYFLRMQEMLPFGVVG